MSIIEVDNPIAVEHFIHRFQVILEVNGKKIFPKNKIKFLEFDENNYIYTLKSDSTKENVRVNEVLFYELLLCDRTLSDCMQMIEDFLITSLREIYFF